MEILHWINTYPFELLQSVGIIVGSLLSALSYRRDVQSRRVENLINLTHHHHEIWKEHYRDPELKRILDPSANLEEQPITFAERLFVTLVVTHLETFFYAKRNDLLVGLDGAPVDVGQFFLLPIPYAVWDKVKHYRKRDFVEFVESARI